MVCTHMYIYIYYMCMYYVVVVECFVVGLLIPVTFAMVLLKCGFVINKGVAEAFWVHM